MSTISHDFHGSGSLRAYKRAWDILIHQQGIIEGLDLYYDQWHVTLYNHEVMRIEVTAPLTIDRRCFFDRLRPRAVRFEFSVLPMWKRLAIKSGLMENRRWTKEAL